MSAHKGGRRKGDSGQRNDGLLKRCACKRKRWSDCPHPWQFTFAHQGQGYFFNLNRRAGLPRGVPLGRTEAERWRNHFYIQIQDGTFDRVATAPPGDSGDGLTLRDMAAKFVDDWKLEANRRAHRVPNLEQQLATICRTVVDGRSFGDYAFDALSTPDVLAFRDARRRLLRDKEAELVDRRKRIAAGEREASALPVASELPHGRKGEVGINPALETLRGLLNWAVERGHYQMESPFMKHGRPVIKMAKEESRTRRLSPDEEARLLMHASPHLRDLIIAALDTAMRKGELLSLQWQDVAFEKRPGQKRDSFVLIRVRAEKAKTDTERTVMSGSSRLLALLRARRKGPDDKDLPELAYVFGNEVGEAIDSVKTSWQATCRRAKIEDLHFHDLRREAASRMDRDKVPRTAISAQLGHARVTTTDISTWDLETTSGRTSFATTGRDGTAGNLLQSFCNPPSPSPRGLPKLLRPYIKTARVTGPIRAI
jgi:integrase